MTLAEVIALINSDIVPNGNNEITANVLRPILIEMLQQPNDLIGDLGDLNTDSSDTLVDAINSVNNALSDVEGLVVLSGQGDPNQQSFPSLSIADLYSEIDGVGSPLALWIYDGTKFIRLSDKYLSYEIPQALTVTEQLTARSNINATDRRLEELASDLTEEERTKIRQKISAASLEDVGNIIDDTQASDDTTYSSNVIDQKLNLKLDAEDLNGLLENPTYDSDTHIFTMDVVGGGTFSIDFPIEALITNVDLDDDNNLVITFEDGSVTTIPLNTLLVGVVKSVNGKTPNSQGVVTINIADIPNLQDELDNKADISDIPNPANDGLLTISTSSDLTGGGTFSADQATASNVYIGLSSGTLASLALADTALQSGDDISKLNNDVGYLTSFTETDPTVPSHVKAITTTNISNWNTAYDWGDFRGYGLGLGLSQNIPWMNDGNEALPNGFYRSGGDNAVNLPDNYRYAPIISLNRNASNFKIALYNVSLGFQDNNNNWYNVWHDGNFNPAQYVLQSALNTQLANYVPINGVTTINNTKTFTSSPIVPNGTLNGHAVNLGQLNDELDGNYLPLAGGTMENGSVINWNSGASAVIQQGGNNRIRATFSNTFISSAVSGTTDGIYLRPRGDINATGQVRINGNGQITTHSHGDSSQWHEAYLAIADKANTDGSNTIGGEWEIHNLKNDTVGLYVATYSFDNVLIGIPPTDALGSADGILLMRDGAPLAIAENINPDWDGYIYRAGTPNSGYPSEAQTGNYLIESKHRFRFHQKTAPDSTSGGDGYLSVQPFNAIEHNFFRVTISGVNLLTIDIKPPIFDEITGFQIERNAIGQKCTVAVSGGLSVVKFTNVAGADFTSEWNKGVFTFYWTDAGWMFGGYSPIEP